jgi:hypothetical protein
MLCCQSVTAPCHARVKTLCPCCVNDEHSDNALNFHCAIVEQESLQRTVQGHMWN